MEENLNIEIIKNIWIAVITYYTNFKIINKKEKLNIKSITKIFIITISSVLCVLIKSKLASFINIMLLTIIIGIVFSKDNVKKGICTTMFSITINYSIFFVAIVLSYILYEIIHISLDEINLIIIIIIHFLLIVCMFKIKKFKYGISLLKGNAQNEYVDIMILNACLIIILLITLLSTNNIKFVMNITPVIIVEVIVLLITIKKSFNVYYKQKLLQKQLEENKQEIEKKDKEIKMLEEENLKFSKTSHSLAHKQQILEYKINKLTKEGKEQDITKIKDQMADIEKELYKRPNEEITKTGIEKIDNIIEFEREKCIENNIEFHVQVKGNVYYIINNIISQDQLEILIADHVKDAIIAINHSENINRSIMVRIGKIEECYGLYVYDSGIEFEKEILKNLGKRPCTTYKDEGGTGMGFMNTFDTLNKCKGSLIIKEIGKPSSENYTKIVMIKFDGKNEFKVI